LNDKRSIGYIIKYSHHYQKIGRTGRGRMKKKKKKGENNKERKARYNVEEMTT